MSQVSRKKLSEKVRIDLVEKLILVFSAIHSKEEMQTFFSALLTDTEKTMLAKRLAMVILISEAESDTDIANALNVTRITVAKFRYFYEARGQEGYKLAFAKLAAEKQFDTFRKLLVSLARYSGRAAGGRVKLTILDLFGNSINKISQ